jgi:hypothetical protein
VVALHADVGVAREADAFPVHGKGRAHRRPMVPSDEDLGKQTLETCLATMPRS